MEKSLLYSAIISALLTQTALAVTQLSNQELQEQDVPTLENIVVTATSSERALVDAPASISVITQKKLQQQPVNDLAKAVDASVGVSLESLGNGRQGISIRGMNSDHTLILINGERINNSASAIAHSDFELGWVPTEALERVEIVRGPMSSLYGSEALGGVVNMITRTATDKWEGSLSSYGVWNDHGLGGDQFKTGFYLGGPLVKDTLGLNLWGEYRYREPLKEVEKPFYALDKQQAKTGHIGLTWTPDAQQRIDASIDMNNEEQESYREGSVSKLPSSGSKPGKPSKPILVKSPDYHLTHDVQRRRYSLSHQGTWSWGDTMLRVYQTELKRLAHRTDDKDAGGPNKFRDSVIDGKASFRLGNHHYVTAGAEYRRESLDDPTINKKKHKAQNHYAVFLQDELFINDKWDAVIGVRADRHEDFGWEFSPRAYLTYRPNEVWTIKAGVGKGFKAPTLKQLSAEYESRAAMGGRGIIRGNPELKPETTVSYELGAAYDDNQFSAGVTLFRNDVNNLIETTRQKQCDVAGRVCLAYENVNKAVLQGAEFTLGYKFSKTWEAEANYTYLSAKNKTLSEPLSDRSRHRANAMLTWKPLDGLSTSVRFEHIGSQYRTTKNQPAYNLVHWYVNYDINKNLSVRAGIENIANKRLALDDISLFSRADEGRRYFAGFTARF